MRFYDPTNVYIETKCVKNHQKELCALGSRAFIITGRHSAVKNGSLDDVTSVLQDAGISYETFNEIEENPSVETVWKAAQIGKEIGVDFVIGIGGGSPLDAAKAIALLIANPEETADCLYVAKDLSTLPIAAIPTTCGTGSEVTPVSVLTRHEHKTKKSISYKIFPDLALVDGKYLSFASRSLIINTAIDALAHCIESYLNSSANLYNRMFSEYGFKLWSQIKDLLTSKEELTEEQRTKLMLTSTVAGMAITHTATSLPHAMSYEITYNEGVPHGRACGIFLSAYMELYASHDEAAINNILTLLGFASLSEFSDYLKSLVGEVSIPRKDAEAYAEGLMNNPGKLSTWPFELSKENAISFYEKSLTLV